MIKTISTLGACMAIAASASSQAYEYEIQRTADGVEYGFHQGRENAPLLIVITTDIKESLTDVYSPAGKALSDNGYSVAAIDVTCHGKDVKKKEKYGLDCWRARADMSSGNIFSGYIANLKSVVTHIKAEQKTDVSKATVLGVSRGGYLAMKAAAEMPEITIVIALAPVTDIFSLREFDGSKTSRSLYSPSAFYTELARKHVFIQINNSDERVGTNSALTLIKDVVAAGEDRSVDLTAVITPRKGHSTSEHEMAAAWALKARQSIDAKDQIAPPK